MEFSEVLRRRSMVRDDTVQPLAPDVVEQVLDAAMRVPTATVRHRHRDRHHPDLAPQDSTSTEEPRHRKDVVHRGQW